MEYARFIIHLSLEVSHPDLNSGKSIPYVLCQSIDFLIHILKLSLDVFIANVHMSLNHLWDLVCHGRCGGDEGTERLTPIVLQLI